LAARPEGRTFSILRPKVTLERTKKPVNRDPRGKKKKKNFADVH